MDSLKNIDNIKSVIILPQTIKMTWSSSNKKFYESEGYIFTKYKDKFDIDVLDLTQGSSERIKCICKYCNNVIEKTAKYISKNHDDICCNNCRSKKAIHTNQIRYGVNSTGQLPWVREKAKKTNLERYGVECAFQAKEVQEKIKQTNLERNGVPYPMMSDKIKQKSEQTCLEKYGVKKPLQNKNIRQKAIDTTLERYGVSNIMELDSIKDKVIKNAIQTMYENNTAPCSQQQRHIHNLIGGALNYPVSRCLLDIAFPEKMIYIEYNGGGHDLCVKLGDISEQEFKSREIHRKRFLQNQGWKVIQIECKADKLLQDDLLIEIINYGISYLENSNHSWFQIDLDNMKINCGEFSTELDPKCSTFKFGPEDDENSSEAEEVENGWDNI